MSEDKAWGGMAMEEWVELKLRQGWTGIVKSQMEMFKDSPEKLKKYRDIWRRVMAEKKAAGLSETEDMTK